MDADFPAAHSMDTRWFAVDRDGHVATFDSGEAGAVPVGASEEGHATSERLRQLLPSAGMIHDLAGRCLPGKPGGRLQDDAWSLDYPVLTFFTSLDPVRPALTAGRAVEVRATEGVAVILRGVTRQEFDVYRAAPEFRGCVLLFGFDSEDGGSLAERGLYEYAHLTENWISGPYGRESLPARPLHVDQLPPDLRQRLGRLRLDLSFAETPYVQPVELTECVSWESAYLDVTGKHVRPMPGKEDEYADSYPDLAEYGEEDGVDVQPPDGGDEES